MRDRRRSRLFAARSALPFALLGLALTVAVALAAPADLDPDFGDHGMVRIPAVFEHTAYAMALQDDGKIVVAGHTNEGTDAVVYRLKPNGKLDKGFGEDGRVTLDSGGDEYAKGVAVQSSGKIVVAGYTDVNHDGVVYRLKPNGKLDDSFGFGGDGEILLDYGGDDLINAMALQPNDRIVLAGETTTPDGDVLMFRLKKNGAFDPSFNGNGRLSFGFASSNTKAYALALQDDGKIVVGGYIDNASPCCTVVYRRNSDGSPDLGFSGGCSCNFLDGVGAYGVAVQDDGRIVVASNTTTADPNILVSRLNPNGDLQFGFAGTGTATIDSGGSEYAQAVAVQPNGRILVAGKTSVSNDAAVYRLKSNGFPDMSFDGDGALGIDGGGLAGIRAITLQPDRRILLAGFGERGGSITVTAVYRLLGP